MQKIRLQKLMAERGVASRRASEELIAAGKVQVNGKKITEMGVKVDEERDMVSVSGKIINKPEQKQPEKKIYLMMNKPTGTVTTASDELGRTTVLDLLKTNPSGDPDLSPKKLPRVWAVGRLDQDTSGLLILTTDGDLTQKLTHPKFEKEKTYVAICGNGEWSAREREVFEGGIRLGARAKKLTAPAKWRLLERRGDHTRKVEIKITEGQNQQVRRMCKAVNHPVIALERMAMGKLKLDTRLRRGAWRELTAEEIKALN
jgi:pseudouridine synthase